MPFIDKFIKTIDVWFADENDANVEKGHDFERYVAELFAQQEKYFSILAWSADSYDKAAGIKVEANRDPDLIIRYIPSNETYAVECKCRSKPAKSKKNGGPVVGWGRPDQIDHYTKFARTKKMPVFVVIGLGGSPKAPEAMYCLPLEKAKNPELFFCLLNDYERDPEKTFFWRKGVLK